MRTNFPLTLLYLHSLHSLFWHDVDGMWRNQQIHGMSWCFTHHETIASNACKSERGFTARLYVGRGNNDSVCVDDADHEEFAQCSHTAAVSGVNAIKNAQNTVSTAHEQVDMVSRVVVGRRAAPPRKPPRQINQIGHTHS